MKVISGGQTGVDQAALRAALNCRLETGGWCPPGSSCESGRIPESFQLHETPEERSPKAPHIPRSLRTEWNVRDSDGTLVLQSRKSDHDDPGTTWTFQCALAHGKPLLLIDARNENVSLVQHWIREQGIGILNIAGPSESQQPGIGAVAEQFLNKVFENINGASAERSGPKMSADR